MTSGSILRNYIDILNEQQSNQVKIPPIPAIPPTDGDLPDGTKAYSNPDGTRSYSGAFGTFTYDKSGKAIKYATPNLGGLGREVDLQTGLVNTDMQMGDLKLSTKQRPDQSTVTSASTQIGANTVSMDQGIGFGGAGKDVEQGGNKIYSVTGPDPDDKRQEPDKQSFAGRKPTQQELGALMKESNKMSLREHIEEVENDGPLSSGDFFHIELAEDEGIETWIIAEWSESVLIEADAATLKLLEEHGCTFHDELTEAEYQGRNVPLGKPMSGDVKKSKVYVKKPNGKVVKVNFGDKKMTIKKSNPKRRKSFRARHNCQNPGPRWKARYWSCRAW